MDTEKASRWRVIWDRGDSIDDAARIFELGHRTDTTLVYPGVRSSAKGLAFGVLVALGKDPDCLPKRRDKAIAAAQMWLAAERVKELIVFGEANAVELSQITSGSETRIWIVTHSQENARSIADGITEVEDVPALFKTLRKPRKKRTNPEELGPFPQVPFNDFFTFVASSNRMYRDEPELRRILGCFRYEISAANRHLKLKRPKPGDWRTDQDASRQIKTFIHQRMLDATCLREAVCRLRAIQTALFLDWIYVRVDLLPLLALLTLDNHQGDQSEIARVGRTLADPKPGFIASLAHTASLTKKATTELQRKDVSADGSRINCEGRVISLPPEHRAFARAYLYEHDQSEKPSPWLFHSATGKIVSRTVRLKVKPCR